jgi:tetratricopeptide (TPR) repeat protein
LEYLIHPIRQNRFAAFLFLPLLLIGLTTSGYYFIWNNTAPVLTDKDVILLTDFENRTGEQIFDGALKQALIIALRQSPFLSIYPEPEVKETLKLMKRKPDEKITRELGREICQRQGLKAYVTGTVSKMGSAYLVGLEAVDAATGERVVVTQVKAKSQDNVIDALSEAAISMRRELGESLATIERYGKPLPQVTTDSLEALKAFAMAEEMRNKRSFPEATTLYEKAIAIDPEFASAYVGLGDMYANTQKRFERRKVLEKAYTLRDKVSERERITLERIRIRAFERNEDEFIKLMNIAKMKYPRDGEIRASISHHYLLQGKFEKAIKEAEENLRMNPRVRYALAHQLYAYGYLNRFEEAKRAIQKHRRSPDDTRPFLYQIAFAQNDTTEMQRHFELVKEMGVNETVRLHITGLATRGRWRRSMEEAGPLIDRIKTTDSPTGLITVEGGLAATARPDFGILIDKSDQAAHLGLCREANLLANKILELKGRTPFRLSHTASVMANCGDIRRAEALLNKVKEMFRKSGRMQGPSVIEALIEVKKGNTGKALEMLETIGRRREGGSLKLPRILEPYIKGNIHLKLNQNEKARQEFQWIVDNPGTWITSILRPLAQLGIARATKDKREYEKFFEMWKEADEDLPVLIEAKKEYQGLG